MYLVNISAETLSRELRKEVPAMYVIIAKHDVYGMDSEAVAEVLSCSVEEIEEAKEDQLYKDVRLYMGALAAQQKVDQSASWDAIENIAMENLLKRLPYEKDGEFLLRVAAVANKAQRRAGSQPGTLDPSRANGTTAIKITQRLVQRFTGRGGEERIEERELSIQDGSMTRPTFEEIDGLLEVSRGPAFPQRIDISTHSSGIDMADLDAEMQRRGS